MIRAAPSKTSPLEIGSGRDSTVYLVRPGSQVLKDYTRLLAIMRDPERAKVALERYHQDCKLLGRLTPLNVKIGHGLIQLTVLPQGTLTWNAAEGTYQSCGQPYIDASTIDDF